MQVFANGPLKLRVRCLLQVFPAILRRSFKHRAALAEEARDSRNALADIDEKWPVGHYAGTNYSCSSFHFAPQVLCHKGY